MNIRNKYVYGYNCIIFTNVILVFIQRILSFYFSQKEMWNEYNVSGDVTKLCIKLMFYVFIIFSIVLTVLSFHCLLINKTTNNIIKEMLLSNFIIIGIMEVIIKTITFILPSFPMPPINNFCHINISTATILSIVYFVYLLTGKFIHANQSNV